MALVPTNEARGNEAGKFVGLTLQESSPPSYPKETEAPAGAPNVLVILTDDVGFAASSTFGGAIPTPTFDRLAKNGLRYNNFNTAGICSATRAALLTGRDNHNVNVEGVVNFPVGYEGYNSIIPKSAATMAEVLKQNGFSTAAFGKWHLTPEWEMSQVGPFSRWPTGMGFEYYYGFLEGDASQWEPALIENTTPLEPPRDDPDYIFDRDMAEHAISWINQQHQIAPNKPFFMYYATGTAHAPHHAPKAWLEKFRGKFDEGWDVLREQTFERQKKLGVIPANAVLTPRPDFLPAWSSLSEGQKSLFARLFEAFAAQLSHADYQIGRIIETLKASGQLDNTMIVFIQGDNGSSAEGGPNGLMFEQSMLEQFKEDPAYVMKHIGEIGGRNAFNHYPAAWAWATNSPFQYFKLISSHYGGIRNGMVVSWPKHLAQTDAVRQQFLHVSDVMPTILDATGVKMPSSVNGVPQMPLDGVSFAYTFDKPNEPSHRRIQVFEVLQNLGIYQDGWWAGTKPGKMPWQVTLPGSPRIEDRAWELYNVEKDFSQSRDLAAAEPAKLASMQRLFWVEAGRNHILPLHDPSEVAILERPGLAEDRRHFVFYPDLKRLPEAAAPRIMGRSFRIEAELQVPDEGAYGVIVAQGGRFSGYTFYLKDGRPAFHYNAVAERQYTVSAGDALTPGTHKVLADFRSDHPKRGSGGMLTLSVDGKMVASGRIEHTLPTWISNTEGLDVGIDTISPVTPDYTVQTSKFTGKLKQVTYDIE